jgi:hypothetical protein
MLPCNRWGNYILDNYVIPGSALRTGQPGIGNDHLRDRIRPAPNRGETYDELINAIKGVGTGWWHCLDSTWLVISNKTSAQVRDELWQHMKSDDQLLVVAYAPQNSAWVGFSKECGEWLKRHM